MIKAFQPGDYRPGERVTCKSVQGESAPPSTKESQDVVDWGSHDKPDQDLIGVAFKPPQPGMATMSSLTLQARQAYAAAMSLSIMGDPMGTFLADLLTMQLSQAPESGSAAQLEVLPDSGSPEGLLHRKDAPTAGGEIGYLLGGVGAALPPGILSSPEEEAQRAQLREGLKVMGGSAAHLKGF